MENFFARSQEQCTKFSTFTAVLGHHVLNLDTAVYGTVLLATGISRTPRFIYPKKAEVSKRQYSSKYNSSNVRDIAVPKVQYRTCIQLRLNLAHDDSEPR